MGNAQFCQKVRVCYRPAPAAPAEAEAAASGGADDGAGEGADDGAGEGAGAVGEAAGDREAAPEAPEAEAIAEAEGSATAAAEGADGAEGTAGAEPPSPPPSPPSPPSPPPPLPAATTEGDAARQLGELESAAVAWLACDCEGGDGGLSKLTETHTLNRTPLNPTLSRHAEQASPRHDPNPSPYPQPLTPTRSRHAERCDRLAARPARQRGQLEQPQPATYAPGGGAWWLWAARRS